MKYSLTVIISGKTDEKSTHDNRTLAIEAAKRARERARRRGLPTYGSVRSGFWQGFNTSISVEKVIE